MVVQRVIRYARVRELGALPGLQPTGPPELRIDRMVVRPIEHGPDRGELGGVRAARAGIEGLKGRRIDIGGLPLGRIRYIAVELDRIRRRLAAGLLQVQEVQVELVRFSGDGLRIRCHAPKCTRPRQYATYAGGW